MQEEAVMRGRPSDAAPDGNMLSFNNFMMDDEGHPAREHPDPESTMEGMTPVRPPAPFPRDLHGKSMLILQILGILYS